MDLKPIFCEKITKSVDKHQKLFYNVDTMLKTFSCANFKSFRDLATIDFTAAKADKNLMENTFLLSDEEKLLKCLTIYGQNSAGKSNFIKAMTFMVNFICLPIKNNSKNISFFKSEPFLLQKGYDKKPSFFEITFYVEKILYRYGFELLGNKVLKEWLFYTKKRETLLFTRDNNSYEVSSAFLKNSLVVRRDTRDESLFLVNAYFNRDKKSKLLEDIISWFLNFNVVRVGFSKSYIEHSIELLKNEIYRRKVMTLLQAADISVDNCLVNIFKTDLQNIPENLNEVEKEKLLKQEKYNFFMVHKLFDEAGNMTNEKILFDLFNQESTGTQRLLFLAPLIIEALEKGSILVLDEIDSQLHPLVLEVLIRIFNSQKNNPRGAQFLLTLQNTFLLDNNLLRRDQIWFVEKKKENFVSEIYSLQDIRLSSNNSKPRNDLSYEKNYILGRFGAIPNIREIDL